VCTDGGGFLFNVNEKPHKDFKSATLWDFSIILIKWWKIGHQNKNRVLTDNLFLCKNYLGLNIPEIMLVIYLCLIRYYLKACM